MEETKIIQGEIINIYRPKDGDFGFDDYALVSFMLKTKDKQYYLCCGESFPIFVSENVILEGTITSNPRGNKMDFINIKIDLSGKSNKTKYLKFICGKGTYENLKENIILKSGRSFNKYSDEAEEYANDKLENYLETENYSMLQSFEGIGDKTAKKIIAKYKQNAGFEKMYNELACYGLTLKDCNKLAKSKELKSRFKDEEIPNIIKRNPYKLMEYVDFSFNKCDIFYSKQGGKYNAVARILAALAYVIKAELAKGHTFSTKEILFKNTIKMLDTSLYNTNNIVDFYEINNCYNGLVKNKRVFEDAQGRIYLSYIYNMEEYIRGYVSNALRIPLSNKDYKALIKEYEEDNHITFGREQKLAIENSLKSRVSVITGGPGTGKTSSLAAMIRILLDNEGVSEDDIALCAPTGKAAKRMMESINGSLGTNMRATTVHTLLEVDPSNPDLETFVYNKDNKLPKRVIVVDEVSMLDLKIAYSLISAVKESTKVIFVGDIEQLPPVGYGYFLRDIIDSGIPCVKLLEIHRQKGDSTIISLSQRIRDEILDFSDMSAKKDFRFVILDNPDYESKLNWIVDTFIKSVERVGLDQTMILTPLNGEVIKKNNPKSKRFGGQQISLAIQDKILPHKEGEPEFERNGWKFRIGSKVIVTKNDNSKGIVNGEIGYIEGINVAEKTFDVDFEGTTVTLDDSNIDDLKLAYAITVHKSQGSEWKNVIYVCFNETRMNKKPLVYTAITRAKKGLMIVGDQNAFLGCIHNKEEYRRSRLLN